eukprot:scaffold85266_cov33-Tisochrysis_lutea.AAC.1
MGEGLSVATQADPDARPRAALRFGVPLNISIYSTHFKTSSLLLPTTLAFCSQSIFLVSHRHLHSRALLQTTRTPPTHLTILSPSSFPVVTTEPISGLCTPSPALSPSAPLPASPMALPFPSESEPAARTTPHLEGSLPLGSLSSKRGGRGGDGIDRLPVQSRGVRVLPRTNVPSPCILCCL